MLFSSHVDSHAQFAMPVWIIKWWSIHSQSKFRSSALIYYTEWYFSLIKIAQIGFGASKIVAGLLLRMFAPLSGKRWTLALFSTLESFFQSSWNALTHEDKIHVIHSYKVGSGYEITGAYDVIAGVLTSRAFLFNFWCSGQMFAIFRYHRLSSPRYQLYLAFLRQILIWSETTWFMHKFLRLIYVT